MSARFYGKDHMPDVELLHILVIWAISFKAHKTLLGKAWESNYSAQTLDLQKGGHFNKGGFFCCLWWFLFLSLFTHLLVFYDIFVFFFFFPVSENTFQSKRQSWEAPWHRLCTSVLKWKNILAANVPKKREGRQKGCIFISKLAIPQFFQLW